MFRFFTPATANKILPEIRKNFDIILSQKDQVVFLQQELQYIIESGMPFESFCKKKQDLNAAVSNLYQAIEHLENKGIMIKSVDDGLLDFPSIRFNEEVWLCWKKGEDRVKFWHGKNEGFSGRKPLGTDGFEDDLKKLV